MLQKQKDLQHLKNAINEKYITTFNHTGSLYCSLQINCNYDEHHVEISMHGYIKHSLAQFNAANPKRPHHSPCAHIRLDCIEPIKYTNPPETLAPLSPTDTRTIKETVGTLLYNAAYR